MSSRCIMVAPNGARRTKADHPRLPISPAELAATARDCLAAGAGAIHLHVRDAQSLHSLDPGAYRQAIAAVVAACPDIVIQVTTEAGGRFDLSTQIAAVEMLRPSCVSFSIAELMREGVRRAERFLAWADEVGISIQFILYSADDVRGFADHWRSGRLRQRSAPRVILVVGRYSATQDSDLAELEGLHAAMRERGLHREAVWMTCAFGRGEMACLERTIELGGHVRVGFENAIVDEAGRLAGDNAERVALAAALIRGQGLAVASPAETAAILGRRSADAFV